MYSGEMTGKVVSVSRDDVHRFSKKLVASILLVEGYGVEGDAHAGTTVQHLSRVRTDPRQPNLRQVHLIQVELFDELSEAGFNVGPAALGENIATAGLDLLHLPRGTVLKIGNDAAVEITGLRNPCLQIDNFLQGLLKAVLPKDEDGNVVRKAGIMSIVISGGTAKQGDLIRVCLPAGPHEQLTRV